MNRCLMVLLHSVEKCWTGTWCCWCHTLQRLNQKPSSSERAMWTCLSSSFFLSVSFFLRSCFFSSCAPLYISLHWFCFSSYSLFYLSLHSLFFTALSWSLISLTCNYVIREHAGNLHRHEGNMCRISSLTVIQAQGQRVMWWCFVVVNKWMHGPGCSKGWIIV